MREHTHTHTHTSLVPHIHRRLHTFLSFAWVSLADLVPQIAVRAYVCVCVCVCVSHTQVISEFSTRDELMSALLASCHIPLLSDGNFFTQYKGST